MSSIADKIKTAQNKDGMLRRALERIIQLYTDRSHFIYELLQNAEDAEATSIKFVQYSDRLEVFHDGRPFTTENLQGLCDIGKSDKVDNLNQIGEFGVGFKSVFGICDTVKLFSAPENYQGSNTNLAVPFAVEINNFTIPSDIPQERLENSFTTKFVFPYTVGKTFSGFKSIDELIDALSSKLQNLGITTLLFMKNLESIHYQIIINDQTVEGEYLLEKERINDHCLLVSALGSSANSLKEESSEKISYLKFSRMIEDDSLRTVDIAFPVTIKNGLYKCKNSKNPYISVYFPTETESKLSFIVQGPYRTTPNRSSIPADDPDNIKLSKETAILLQQTILELKQTGKFNYSFIKALPLSERDFENYSLFYPLYINVMHLFIHENIIPCKSGGYTYAKNAYIARNEKLTALLTDELLSDLINDGKKYCWLPAYLTESNSKYEAVYRYFVRELGIDVIRPEDLKKKFDSNPNFLSKQSDNWIVSLYNILEKVGAAFLKSRYEDNMLTANIIKTSTDEFVAAYRKTENGQYIPNVFLPVSKIRSSDIYLVDSSIYARCQHFFDDILQLQKPNEYELFIKDITKRYSVHFDFDEEKHIEDLSLLCKYLKYDEYKDEVSQVIKKIFVVRCTDSCMRNPNLTRIYLLTDQHEISFQVYFKNIAKNIFFVDEDFYANRGISADMLCAIGVQNSLIKYDDIVQGQYDAGGKGKQPLWHTWGDFRWKMTIEYLKEAVKYISEYPAMKDAIIKSKAILDLLIKNEARLCGNVMVSGSTPCLYGEYCELVKVLRGERTCNWNGKWLYTESMELVSQKSISKHDLNASIYGKVKSESNVYELIGFKKTITDEVDDLKMTISKTQLDAYFEYELMNRFGLTSDELSKQSSTEISKTEIVDIGDRSFPTAHVKNIESLKKHAAEMLCFANPVKFDYSVRRVRVSNRSNEARAYLLNMYRYDDKHRYACQMCHDSFGSIVIVQIFNDPETELDPMNLCLCPNCATLYRQIRNEASAMELLKEQILDLAEYEITGKEHITLSVDEQELWFTQIHIAEVQALMKLEDDVKRAPNNQVVEIIDNGYKTELATYATCKGKQIKRKDGFLGKIINVNSEYLEVKILNGQKANTLTKIQLSFLLQNPNVYEIEAK